MFLETKNRLYRIVLPYAAFGVIVDFRGTVIETAPIARWSKGRHISTLRRYAFGKGGHIELIELEDKGGLTNGKSI